MRYPNRVLPYWTPLHLAPFVIRRTAEPTDHDLELDAELEHMLACYTPDHGLIRVDWTAGLVEVLSRNPDTDAEPEEGYSKCVSSHPARFRSKASRTMSPGSAMLYAGLVENFWSVLTERQTALIVGDVLAVYARGGPRPVEGFRKVPADIWASSTIDWGADTCTSPDGHVYFSIHVARSDTPSSRHRGEADLARPRKETLSVIEAPAVVPAGDLDGMDVLAAGRFLGVSKSSLDKWRLTANGPPFHRVGTRVRYLKSDLEKWRDRRREPGRLA